MQKTKLKTNRSAAKRIKVTGTGKLKRYQAGKRHLLTSKDRGRKKNLATGMLITKENMLNMKRLLPYAGK